MGSLPIVQRELLVASRRISTYRSRMLSAGLLLGFGIILYGAFQRSAGTIGPRLLQILSVLLFLECSMAGVRYTADCLSEEKREGTLGLLFLTGLTGVDVVLGKVTARSLSAIHNLLATIPVLALPILIGGIALNHVTALSVVLLLCLIFSLAVGAWISSRGVRERTVLVETILFLVVINVVPFVVSDLAQRKLYFGFEWLACLSPVHTFLQTPRGFAPEVNRGCWAMLAMITVLLGYSSWRIRRSIGEGEKIDAATKVERARSNGRYRHLRTWQRNLTHDPLLWLAQRDGTSGSRIFQFCLAAILFGVLARFGLEAKWRSAPLFVICGAYGFHALYKFMVAADSARQLNEGRRSGALELLLSTPLPAVQFVRSQIFSTARTWIPAAICVGVMNLLWMTEGSFWRELGVVLPCSVLLLFVDSYTLTWRACLNALDGENYTRTVLRTFFQVIIPPLAAIVVILAAAAGGSARKETIQTIFIVWTIASIGFDLGLARISMAKLNHFRKLAAGEPPRANV